MRQRLNLKNMTENQIRTYNLNQISDVVKVIDIVNNHMQRNECITTLIYSNPPKSIADFDEQTREKIRRSAFKWANAFDNFTRVEGIRLGLWGGWDEFLELAIKLMSRGTGETGNLNLDGSNLNNLTSIASNIGTYSGTLSENQFERLKQIILTSRMPEISSELFSSMFYSLTDLKREDMRYPQLCWEIIGDDRVYLWWDAAQYFVRFYPQRIGLFGSLPDKIKLRLVLAGYKGADADTEAKAKAMLAALFKPEMVGYNSRAWNGIFRELQKQEDKKTATKTFMDFLEKLPNASEIQNIGGFDNALYRRVESARRIIWTINAWYSQDLGKFGTDRAAYVDIRTESQLKSVIDEAMKWYKENPQAEPLNLSFLKGQVVDTLDRPIPKAVLTLRWAQSTRDAQGRMIQSEKKELKGQSDKYGNFKIENITKDETSLRLDVEAEGFVPRRGIPVERLDDQSFRINQRVFSNDIVTMDRSGKISGLAIDANGNPLKNGELQFQPGNYPFYSSQIFTNSNGRFVIDNVPAGFNYLTYCKTMSEQVSRFINGRDVTVRKVEYEGPAGIISLETTEGQEFKDAVLDLTKSTASVEIELKDKAGNAITSAQFFITRVINIAETERSILLCRCEAASESGVYLFSGLPAGRFKISATGENNKRSEENVELSENKTTRCEIIQ